MKKYAFVFMLCMATALLCACSASSPMTTEKDKATVSKLTVQTDETVNYRVEEIISEYNAACEPAVAEADENEAYLPLTLSRCVCRIGDNYIVYPQVLDSEPAEKINAAICNQVQARAEMLGVCVFTEYRVEYNQNGIFSIRIFLYDMYDENAGCIDCIPLTFNAETGELCRISDLFSDSNQRWRGRIPDIITSQANESQMVLLSDIQPISDERQFYITDEAVVIMYDLYEISVYEAGNPEFEIMVDDVAEYLEDSSVLNAMLESSCADAPDGETDAGTSETGVPNAAIPADAPNPTEVPVTPAPVPTPDVEEER